MEGTSPSRAGRLAVTNDRVPGWEARTLVNSLRRGSPWLFCTLGSIAPRTFSRCMASTSTARRRYFDRALFEASSTSSSLLCRHARSVWRRAPVRTTGRVSSSCMATRSGSWRRSSSRLIEQAGAARLVSTFEAPPQSGPSQKAAPGRQQPELDVAHQIGELLGRLNARYPRCQAGAGEQLLLNGGGSRTARLSTSWSAVKRCCRPSSPLRQANRQAQSTASCRFAGRVRQAARSAAAFLMLACSAAYIGHSSANARATVGRSFKRFR